MKKICFLMDSIFSFGGVQRVTAVIAKELAKTYDVTIVTFDAPQSEDTTLYGLNEANLSYRFFSWPAVGWLANVCCKAYSLFYRTAQPSARWASDLYARSSFPAVRRKALVSELASGHYDAIIGVHAPLTVRLATVRSQLPGVRLIGWIHNSFEALFGDGSLYIGPRLKRHYVYQYRKMDRVIVLCQHDAETYRQFDALFRPVVIYNPLTLEPGAPARGTSRKFLAVGRFSHRHKGFDLLIQAFSLFAKKNHDWTLDIVGEGPEEELYRRLISDCGLESRITLHPFTQQIQDYYSQAQVYVLSSRWEGFGLVLVEAMAHGLPVVSSDLPTSKEIMGSFGLYFENGNAGDLARQLENATRIDWQRESATAFQIADRFSVGHIMEQWKALLAPARN